MSRLAVGAFAALAAATIAAFFIVQHLKVATPFVAGDPAPVPSVIDPVGNGVCLTPTPRGPRVMGHRVMHISFYLLHESDEVNVDIVSADGGFVRRIGADVYMRGGAHPVRHAFSWDGRTASGAVAPDGDYYIRVTLIHQDRSVLIAANNGASEPVIVDTKVPHPRVTSVSPKLIPQRSGPDATIHFTGNDGVAGRALVYRSAVRAPLRLVKSFATGARGTARWNGTGPHEMPAPQGTYLIGYTVTNKACTTGRFPATATPARGSTPGAGVSVRYLAAQPPLVPVAVGARATVFVDAVGHLYRWVLRVAGSAPSVASGATRDYALRVRPPAGGLYELSLSYGTHATTVPLIAGAAGRAPLLVVLPALTWQGLNPVDDTGDGLPDTLLAGVPIRLARPLVDGLPAGFADEAALVAYLRSSHRRFTLTTDLGLSSLDGVRTVVLDGSFRWLPVSVAALLRAWVSDGGRLLSVGVGSLRSVVRVTGGRALDPTSTGAADALGAHPLGAAGVPRGTLILAGRDGLGIFRGTSGVLRGYAMAERYSPASAASLAGVTSAAPSIIGYRLGRGVVVDIGLAGFGTSLRRSVDARELLARILTVLRR